MDFHYKGLMNTVKSNYQIYEYIFFCCYGVYADFEININDNIGIKY